MTALYRVVTALLLLSQVEINNAVNDCQILQKNILNISEPTSVALDINYKESKLSIGLSLFYLANLEHENKGKFTFWKHSNAEHICTALEATYTTDFLTMQDMSSLENDQGFMLDFTFLKQTIEDNGTKLSEIQCLVGSPTHEIFTEEICDSILNSIGAASGTEQVKSSELQLKEGRNTVFLTQQGITLNKPSTIVCTRRDASIQYLNEKLMSLMEDHVEELRSLDKAFGSRFEKTLDMTAKDCDLTDFKTMLETDMTPDKVSTCFDLKDLLGRPRGKRMSVIEMKSESGADSNQVNEINENFKRLNDNEKRLFHKYVMLKLDSKLESNLLETHDKNLHNLESNMFGLITSKNVLDQAQLYTQEVEAAASRVIEVEQNQIERIRNFKAYMNGILERKHLICHDLVCFRNEDLYFSAKTTGLSLFFKGMTLGSTAGKIAVCTMNSDQKFPNGT